MKKRLLSAVLAFAMVLTLIPAAIVPAFAVTYADPGTGNPDDVPYTDAKGDPHRFWEDVGGRVSTVQVTYQEKSDDTTNRVAGHWYWLDNKNDTSQYKYYEPTGGLIVGVGNSGNWYPGLDEFFNSSDRLISTSFTLLDDDTVVAPTNPKDWPTTLTVDVNGHNLDLGGLLTGSGELATNFSSLTITDRRNPLTNTYTGSVSAISKDTSARTSPAPTGVTYSNFTMNLSNITVPSITLLGGTNTVTLNNVTVGGDITMDGTTTTTTVRNGVNVSTSTTYYAQTLNVNTGENETRLSTTTNIGGDIDITGNNCRVVLNNAVGGSSAVSLTGVGGSLNVDGRSWLDDIAVGSPDGGSDTAAQPSVVIDGGAVGNITRTNTDSKQANSVTVNYGATAASITSSNGKVTVNQGTINGNVTVQAGSLDITGPVTTGDLNLGEVNTTTLSIKGTGSKIRGVFNKGKIVINSWPDSRKNNFTTLSLGDYKGRGVTGGTFGAASLTALQDPTKSLWFSKDLQLVVDMQTTPKTYALYGKTEMARAISDITSAVAGDTTVSMTLLGHSGVNTLKLTNGGVPWANIGYDEAIGMILPEQINGYSVATWTSGDNKSSVPSGSEQTIPLPSGGGTEFELHANGVVNSVVKSITKATVSHTNGTVQNQNVRVTMNGNNIQISGAITPGPGSNIATIELDLTTDALKTGTPGVTAGGGSESNGYIVLQNVQVFYNVDTKTVGFNKLQKISNGAIVNDAGELVLDNGTGAKYTVSASLQESAPSLELAPEEIQAVLSGNLARRSQTEKDKIVNQIAGTGAEFDINGNRAVLEAINAVQATITNDKTVENWITSAQNYVWTNGNKYVDAKGQPNGKGKGDPTDVINPHTGKFSTTGTFGDDGLDIASKYKKAYIVPYLVVNANDMSQTGTMNATLTVYYRVDVSGDTYNSGEYYTVQTGRALSALTGDMATNPVKVKFATAFPYASAYIHQDGKYVYQKNATPVTPNANSVWSTESQYAGWLINHAGSAAGSLGTIELNTTPGTIILDSTIRNRAPRLLQGVTYDDLQAAVDDTVPGLLSGLIPSGAEQETMDTITIGGKYAPTECSIAMTGIARKVALVSSGNRTITNGNSATTVDKQSQVGYNYIIQLKNDNVPAGTVAIGVTGSTDGTASVSATSAKAGQTVTVTVTPVAGKTAVGVTVKTNTGAVVTATPTGTANQYSFTVPNGATSVTVSPVFNASTGLPFTDVAASDTFFNAVKWNYDNKYIQGTTATTFRPYNLITRGQIVLILYRNAGSPSVSYNSYPYNDMPTYDAEMCRAIVWATNTAKIVNGYGDGRFGPSNNVRNQELAKILYLYNVYRGKAMGTTSVDLNAYFTDASQIASWAKPYVQWAVGNGVMGAITGKQFQPQLQLQRYQVAVDVYNYGLRFGA